MKFHDSLPIYDWDQMLPIGVTTEQLYQAFKARLVAELFPPGKAKGPFDVEIAPLSASAALQGREG